MKKEIETKEYKIIDKGSLVEIAMTYIRRKELRVILKWIESEENIPNLSLALAIVLEAMRGIIKNNTISYKQAFQRIHTYSR